MIITRKIELWLSEENKEERNEQWRYLKKLNDEVFRAANIIVSNQFFNDTLETRTITDDERLINIDSEIRKLYRKKEENKKEIKELAEKKKQLQDKAKKFYGTSKQNTTYRITSRNFPDMPSNIANTLNSIIIKTIKAEKNEVSRGDKSIRNYRKGIPIPFQFSKTSSPPSFKIDNEEIYLQWLKSIKFKLHFGRDSSGNKTIVTRAIEGQYKYCDSSIQLKNNKIFLLLVVDIDNNKIELNPKISVGVDLGIAVPACCALSDSKARLFIGSKEDLLKIRLQMQSRRRRLQRALKLTTGGKGRKKKLHALEALIEKERNYVKTYNHMLSHQVVKFAKDHAAGIIKMEMLEGFGRDEKNKFILRNWSYFELEKMVEYKATREGMRVVYIDPYHTSQNCALCGHYEEGQRKKQSEFICKNPECKQYDETVNADYNAAINIAISTKIVTKKEDCEYYKINKADNEYKKS